MTNVATQKDGLLDGGWGQENPPEKIGNTVHREMGENSDYVHSVLSFLDDHGFTFAPDFLGIDEAGREILEFIDGDVPHGGDTHPNIWSTETMQDIFKQIRSFHDLTAGTELAGSKECVCHGDLSYANTVYRNGKAVAFIDWDWAHPGTRVEDVAHALLTYLSIGEYEGEGGATERAEVAKILIDAYGLSQEARAGLVDAMLQSLLDIRKQQLDDFEKGKASAQRVVEAKIPDLLLKRHAWLEKHRKTFEGILR